MILANNNVNESINTLLGHEWIWVIFIIVFIVVIVIIGISHLNNNKKTRSHHEIKIQRPVLKDATPVKTKKTNESSPTHNDVSSNSGKQEDTTEQKKEPEETQTNEPDPSNNPVVEHEETPATFDYKYLEEPFEGGFYKSYSNAKGCFFRCWVDDNKTWFEFCGKESVAIAHKSTVFDQVCLIIEKNEDPTKVVTIQPGILDDNLKVIEPSKIKLV